MIYYTTHRLYRRQDQNYLTLKFKWEAADLTNLEGQLKALGAGLVVAGAEQLSLEEINIGFRRSKDGVLEVGSHDFVETLQAFLGVTRKRTVKQPPKEDKDGNGTEARNETDHNDSDQGGAA
jgi:hypothetical protein